MQSKRITHDGPSTGLLVYWIGRFWMWLTGWKVVGRIPPGEKFVFVGAPHTSNWDLPFTLASFYVLRLKISWMGKDKIFKKPFGGIMRWLGGIPINRASKHGVVDQIAKQFKESKKLVIVVPPSGTRKKRDYWKSGFYWIAFNAKVPILCAYLDYPHKEAGLGLSFIPTGNLKKDMDRIREYYKDKRGKFPDMESTIRLRDEEMNQVSE
jgi:1-acyl-sn-glycerol-3-phosphate acyltransferase